MRILKTLKSNPTMRQPSIFAAVTIAFAVASAPLLGADSGRTGRFDFDSPVPGTYALPVLKMAADGEVLDSAGRKLRLEQLTHGRITVLSFIYTRCASAGACPHATGVLNQLHRLSEGDSAMAKEMRLVSMSFDPEHDTPERMAAYSAWAGSRTNAAEWHFLTSRSKGVLQPVLDAYGQVVTAKANPNAAGGPLNHTLRVYLIDRQGRIRNIYSSGTLDVRLVMADVKTLMLEGREPSTNR